MSCDPASTASDASGEPAGTDRTGGLTRPLDRWMHENPWHPRVTPFLLYIVALMVIAQATRWTPIFEPLLYGLACVAVTWLLWRYRRWTTELNWRFHWLAIPTGLALTGAWIGLGYAWNRLTTGSWGVVALDATPVLGPIAEQHRGLLWLTIVLRLVGMVLVVPMFEELFVRSAIIRGVSHPRRSAIGLLQLLGDLPLIGEWFDHTPWGRKAGMRRGMFTEQLTGTPVGHITMLGLISSTVVFMASHQVRDWAGCIACAMVWCALLWWTNRSSLPAARRLGLGPIVWSHAITNAALWAWTIHHGDWQFL